jgi:hypothetical protein
VHSTCFTWMMALRNLAPYVIFSDFVTSHFCWNTYYSKGILQKRYFVWINFRVSRNGSLFWLKFELIKRWESARLQLTEHTNQIFLRISTNILRVYQYFQWHFMNSPLCDASLPHYQATRHLFPLENIRNTSRKSPPTRTKTSSLSSLIVEKERKNNVLGEKNNAG